MVFALTVLGAASSGFVAPARATAIGDSKSALPDNSGDRHEPTANEPESPLPEERGTNGAATDFENFPTSATRDLSEPNDEFIDEADTILASITDIAPIPDFADALTALDWVRRWADTGYWLEIDQWTDFKAVAIAGYSPEIRYWLGRDSWSSVSSAGAGIGTHSPASNNISTMQHRMAVHNLRVNKHGRALDDKGVGPKKRDAMHDQSATMTIRKLAGSMIRKMAEQPMFYVIFACGFGLLFWALRQQKRTLQKQEPTRRRRTHRSRKRT